MDLLATPRVVSDYLIVACCDDTGVDDLVAACDPAMVFQTMLSLFDPSQVEIRSTFEHAIRCGGVRRVVVRGHERCGLRSASANGAPSTVSDVVAMCQALRYDAFVGPLLRSFDVAMAAMWVDEVANKTDVRFCTASWESLAFDQAPRDRADALSR